jgi:hypothetical protein
MKTKDRLGKAEEQGANPLWSAWQQAGKTKKGSLFRQNEKPYQIGNDPSKFKEQSGNVYENKGPLWKTRERSWNLIENKWI